MKNQIAKSLVKMLALVLGIACWQAAQAQTFKHVTVEAEPRWCKSPREAPASGHWPAMGIHTFTRISNLYWRTPYLSPKSRSGEAMRSIQGAPQRNNLGFLKTSGCSRFDRCRSWLPG
jgi:hypothetical protein